MKAETTVVIDGETYQPGEEIGDLGSFVAVNATGKVRHYEGLSKDAPSKLPTYVSTGSTALCYDTGDLWKYHRPTNKWYKL